MQDGYHLQYVSPHTVEAWSNSYLAWYLRILRAKTNRDGLPSEYTISKRAEPMTPEFSGLGSELRSFKRMLAEETGKLRTSIIELRQDIPTTFAETHAAVAEVREGVQQVKDFNRELKRGANDPDPINGSESSAEPRKSWTNGSDQQHEQNVQEQQTPRPGVDMGAGSQS